SRLPLDYGLDTGASFLSAAARAAARARTAIVEPHQSFDLEVCDRSGAFAPTARQLLGRSDLAVMWLEHLLLHSMLQHESGTWTWGRYVVVYPEGNVDLTDAVARYREHLVDDSTYATVTVEELLAARALPGATTTALRERYLPP
ncbi:MAG TPA: hypothetical protein VF076_09365, partial [Acidimicrobiales bacterium]